MALGFEWEFRLSSHRGSVDSKDKLYSEFHGIDWLLTMHLWVLAPF
jgi:hypothetical protein